MHAPLKIVKISKSKAPWMIDTIKLMINIREKALAKAKKTRSRDDWTYYKTVRSYVTSAITREKRAYLHHIENSKSNKKPWKTIKTLMLLKLESLVLYRAHLSNPDLINNFFVSSSNTNLNVDMGLINYYENELFKHGASFEFQHFTYDDVSKAINSIKSNASGHDCISKKMLQICMPQLNIYFTYLFNCCLQQGIFPGFWKISVVKPLNKIKIPLSLSDLRPISLLPILSKVFERLTHNQIVAFIKKYDFLPGNQSGFRSGSTTSALLKVANNLICGLDKGENSI